MDIFDGDGNPSVKALLRLLYSVKADSLTAQLNSVFVRGNFHESGELSRHRAVVLVRDSLWHYALSSFKEKVLV